MKSHHISFLAGIIFLFTALSPLSAQTLPGAAAPGNGADLVIATRAVSPFVIVDGSGQLTGLSIDLWRAIAADRGLKTRFQLHQTLPQLLDAVQTGKAAAGIAAISITADRETKLDFSHPMFRSGLAIMVPAGDGGIDVAKIMFSKTMLTILVIFLAVILIPAHIFWLIARGRDEGLPIRESYFPGIFDAILWCAESMGGAAQSFPRRALPRIVALVWLYAGIVLISYFTAFATTSLTLQTLRGDINGPDDLAGKRVAVVAGSTSADFIAGTRAVSVPFPDFSTCAAEMLAGRVDAVVYDAPVIQYYSLKQSGARMAGRPFRPENYGIAFPIGSPLRRSVNQGLLNVIESGTYDTLTRKWLGEASVPTRAE